MAPAGNNRVLRKDLTREKWLLKNAPDRLTGRKDTAREQTSEREYQAKGFFENTRHREGSCEEKLRDMKDKL